MKNVIYLILFGLSAIVHSQNSISGKITDEDNSPIFGVQIYIEQIHLGTTSDENGYFILNNIPNGDHLVVFHYVGFKSETRKVYLSNTDREISLQLTESVFLMD